MQWSATHLHIMWIAICYARRRPVYAKLNKKLFIFIKLN